MRLLTLADVTRILGLSEATVRKMANQLPGAVRINRRVRYRADALEAFINRGGCCAEQAATAPTARRRAASPPRTSAVDWKARAAGERE